MKLLHHHSEPISIIAATALKNFSKTDDLNLKNEYFLEKNDVFKELCQKLERSIILASDINNEQNVRSSIPLSKHHHILKKYKNLRNMDDICFTCSIINTSFEVIFEIVFGVIHSNSGSNSSFFESKMFKYCIDFLQCRLKSVRKLCLNCLYDMIFENGCSIDQKKLLVENEIIPCISVLLFTFEDDSNGFLKFLFFSHVFFFFLIVGSEQKICSASILTNLCVSYLSFAKRGDFSPIKKFFTDEELELVSLSLSQKPITNGFFFSLIFLIC
jgi:hypothetical protein